MLELYENEMIFNLVWLRMYDGFLKTLRVFIITKPRILLGFHLGFRCIRLFIYFILTLDLRLVPFLNQIIAEH